MIAEYADVFINLLNSRSNRLVWGSMTALASIAELVPEAIHERIALLLQALENGSVITVDNCVSVLAGLCKANEKYKEELFPVLLEHLKTCRPKETAQHAERIAVCVDKDNRDSFIEVIDKRMEYLPKSQINRLQKLKKALGNLG